MPLIWVNLRHNPEENGRRDSDEREANLQRSLSKLSTVGSHLSEVDIEVSALTSCEVAEAICEHISKVTADDHFTTESSLEPVKALQVKALPEKQFADIEGFKHVFIKDLLDGPPDRDIQILCWLKSRPRDLSAMLFLPVCDSTGTTQVVVDKSKVPSWIELRALKSESSITVSGIVRANRESCEIVAQQVAIVSRSSRLLHPEIRKLDKDLLAHHNTDKLLASRHLYLRNPLLVALNLYRSDFMLSIHQWFEDHRFVNFSAPLITPSLLYEPKSAIHISNLKANKPLYLSQCAGFYLEAAAHAHERVYNLGPSFRNESRTNRHLMEYWHIKAELCSGQMDDIIDLVEIFLRDLSKAMSTSTKKLAEMLGTTPAYIQIPFTRVTYQHAIEMLNCQGISLAFGQNISKQGEELLTKHFDGPVWITHKPLELEPFPYCIHPTNNKLTMTADLISSNGFGEICGVAEKSFTREELELRLKEKDKLDLLDIYGWVLESRDFGMAPHTAFGMGFERVARWFCGVPHVKDMIPFPRIFDRYPLP